MKKLLLATAVATFASSALAAEGTFYLRGDLGGSILPTQREKNYDIKVKSSTHLVGDLGVGYYLMDNVRSEVVLSNHFSPKQKGSKNGLDIKVAPLATSLHVKGLVDFYDFGFGQTYFGAGLGLSQVSGKFTAKYMGVESAMKWKKKNNFSYLLTVGAGFDVADGVKLDVAYSYNDHGKLSKLKGSTSSVKYNLRTHDITGGVRVEL
ncbi:MAG: outer membrane beta-barrel protein [Rickettsiaceae bacterium]|nr:outer membrane beta-barrel protein [Rickettsiaceae bacterium]